MAAPTSTTSRTNARPLVLAAISVIVAGLALAALILVATGRGGAPKNYAPFAAGLERQIRSDTRAGGPVLYPDPFGGRRSIWTALEHGRLVAVANHLWHQNSCSVRWRGSVGPTGSFVDCHGNRLTSEELPRYPTSVPSAGPRKGAFLVDVRTLLPPPALTATSSSIAPAT